MKKQIILGTILITGLASAQTLPEAIKKTDNERYESAASDFKALIAKEANNGANYFYYGENYFKRGDIDSANTCYLKGTELSPTYPMNFVGAGKVMLSKNDVNGAKAQFFKATSISQNKNAEVFRKIAEAYLSGEFKNPDEAMVAANAAIKLDPKNPEGYIILGDAMLEKNPADGGGPIKQYKQATTLDPKSAKGIIREGKLYQRGRNYQLALDKYKEAEAIDPTFAPAFREKAELYFLAGQAPKSIENWKKYLELNNSDYARYRYMSALYNNKQYTDAVAEYEGLKAKGFKNLYFERLAGYSYYEMGDKTDKEAFNKGLAALNNFFTMAPQNFKYIGTDYKYKGMLLARTGKDSIAMIEMEKAVAADPASSKLIYTEMANIAYRVKKYDKVISVIDKKRTEDPTSLDITDQFNYGRANYFTAGSIRTAAAALKDKKAAAAKEAETLPYHVKADSAFSNVIRLNPKWVTAYTYRGKNAFYLGLDVAKASYEKVLEIVKPEEKTGSYKKDVIEALEFLGYYYVEKKDKAKADEIFTALKEIDPTNQKQINYFKPATPQKKQ
jgi:tetratricopeptide (TPR) repeat protein